MCVSLQEMGSWQSAAGAPDIVCAYEMAGSQLTQCCQSAKHRKCGKQMMEQSDRTESRRNRANAVTAGTGRGRNGAFLGWDWRCPLLWRRLGSQTWVGFQLAHPHVTAPILVTISSKTRSHASKGRRNSTTFPAFLSRSLGCSPPQPKASRSLVLE